MILTFSVSISHLVFPVCRHSFFFSFSFSFSFFPFSFFSAKQLSRNDGNPCLNFFPYPLSFQMHSCISIRRCVRPSVRPSVRHTRVEFLPNLTKIESGLRQYAILKTIQRQVRGQFARTHLLFELCSTCYLVFIIQSLT